jgi:hypothetical protein
MKSRTFISLGIYSLVRLPIWITVPYLWWYFVLDVVAVIVLIASSELRQ